MAISGSGTLSTFLKASYYGSGENPGLRWKYDWSYDPAKDEFNIKLTLQVWAISDITSGSSAFYMWRSQNKLNVDMICGGESIASYNGTHKIISTANSWTDQSLVITGTISGSEGEADISIVNYAQIYIFNYTRGNCDNTQKIHLKADRGVVRVNDGSSFKAALAYINDGSGFKQAIPYVNDGSSWDIGV